MTDPGLSFVGLCNKMHVDFYGVNIVPTHWLISPCSECSSRDAVDLTEYRGGQTLALSSNHHADPEADDKNGEQIQNRSNGPGAEDR